MPINGVLDMQRRSVQIGEIRIGTSVEVPGKNHRRPVRLETFRFTTASEQTAHAIAARYGGTVAPWSQRKGRWEVVTDRTALDVWVPPRGEAVDANMELWDGPRCLRRCDGITESLSGTPCLCPQPDDRADAVSVQRARDERVRLAGLRPPQACKPLTRINVTIPDLPGLLGVFRLNTGSVNAAVETADSGEAMEIARAGGKYLPAVLRIEWRVRAADGKPYPVPVLQIGLSMREIAAGKLPAGPGGLLAQLQGSPAAGQLALTAGQAQTPAPEPEVPNEPPLPEPSPADESEEDETYAETRRATAIYQRAQAATSRSAVEALAAEAQAGRLNDTYVCTSKERDHWEPLKAALQDIWRAQPGSAA